MLAQEETGHAHHMTMMAKGKRTKRPRPPSPMTLTMSISGEETARPATSSSTTTTDAAAAHVYTSPTPAAVAVTEEEEDMAHCLILLARGGGGKIEKPDNHRQPEYSPAAATITAATAVGGGMYVYECKTCNRCFPSFQALGGHRASHKKPRLQPEEKVAALSLVSDGHQQFRPAAESGKSSGVEGVGLSLQMACNSSNTLSASNNHSDNTKSKVHACAICSAEFSSGQALGGHMRRHRSLVTVSPATQSASPPAPPRNQQLSLDLNLPADEQEEQQSPSFMFPTKEKTLVFAASLVDCRY